MKPSNLILDANGHLWVSDFGLATTSGQPDVTLTGDVVGTLRYMSPEQAAGRRQDIDHRTDIYSLGVTLYELATLEQAFPGHDSHQLMRRVIESDPPQEHFSNGDIPKDLQAIVLKAMAKKAYLALSDDEFITTSSTVVIPPAIIVKALILNVFIPFFIACLLI